MPQAAAGLNKAAAHCMAEYLAQYLLRLPVPSFWDAQRPVSVLTLHIDDGHDHALRIAGDSAMAHARRTLCRELPCALRCACFEAKQGAVLPRGSSLEGGSQSGVSSCLGEPGPSPHTPLHRFHPATPGAPSEVVVPTMEGGNSPGVDCCPNGSCRAGQPVSRQSRLKPPLPPPPKHRCVRSSDVAIAVRGGRLLASSSLVVRDPECRPFPAC